MVYLDFLVGKWNSQYIELFKYDENVKKKKFWSNQERQMSSAVLNDSGHESEAPEETFQ